MRQGISVVLVLMLLFPGCLDEETDNLRDIDDSGLQNDDPGTGSLNETVNQTVEVREPELVEVSYEEGCDNINPLHCMLPFPSNAFLREDSTTETGFRVNYADSTFPEAGIVYETKIPGLSRLDGMSPATQIMTAFDRVPDLAEAANQSTIAKSLEVGHPTILLNLDSGEILPHWVEIDLRSDDDSRTLVYIRTLSGLDHNAEYGIGISGLESNGTLIEPSLAFKVMIDPHVGRLVYLRVYSGNIKAGASVYNSTKGIKERLGRVLTMHANRREEAPDISAGSIAAAIGLKNTFTGDTICSEDGAVILESIRFPEPVVSVAIEPKTRMDQEKLIDSMIKLSEEDPTFRVKVDRETGQTIMSGMGELHLEVLVERLRREFQVDANIGRPKVSYRESITSSSKAEGRFVRQTGGHGQYGHVELEIEPLERNSGIKFESKIMGGAVPREFIHPVENGIKEALESGVMFGYPVIDVKVTLVDGSYHPVDSSEMAFKMAGSIGVKEAIRKANAVLLEPIMAIEVVTPEEYLGEILGDLGGRRSRIEGMDGSDETKTIKAFIPLAETFGYITTLRSISQGRASQSMEFDHYEQVPQGVVQELVKV